MSARGDKHGGDGIDVLRGLHAAVMLSGVFNLDLPIRILPVRAGRVQARECAQVRWDLFWFRSDADYPFSFVRCLELMGLSDSIEMIRRIIEELARQRKSIIARINRGAITGPFTRSVNRADCSELEYRPRLCANRQGIMAQQPKWYSALLEDRRQREIEGDEYDALEMIACGAIKGRTPGSEFFEQRYHAHA